MVIYGQEMELVKVGPSVRERVEHYLAGKHHQNVVNRLRHFREELEEGAALEPWSVIEAPAVLLLADICEALQLTPEETATVLGEDGQHTQDSLLDERIVPQQLNPRQKQALIEVHRRGQITNGELQRVCPKVTPETLRLDLADLVERGLLRREGRCRGTYYTALV
jgi:hypothetical protein